MHLGKCTEKLIHFFTENKNKRTFILESPLSWQIKVKVKIYRFYT
ncbi:hypothetical protein RU96_GL002067 [Enterococcus canintestini]|uniref:Uncharacterized protein n=1 Tax=Enterococcus canintestini TaxID=317010 RepID=A0A1L8R7N7_9ENTE|nr:hypothetical protein RU96_GL002067 [Enterococcus canintestini]